MESGKLYQRLRYFPKSYASNMLFCQSRLPSFSSKILPSFSSKILPSILPPSNLFISFSFFHTTAPSETSKSSLFSSEFSSDFAKNNPFACSSGPLQTSRYYVSDGTIYLKLYFHRPQAFRCFSSYSASFDQKKRYANSNEVSEIVDLIRADVNDLGSILNMMDVALSKSSIVQIFRMLASERVSVLEFFHWLKGSHPDLCCDPDICNLIIDNCGLLENYDAMIEILNEFRMKNISLGPKAFGFLLLVSLNKTSLVDNLKKTMKVLHEVGGSCRTFGVQALVEMFGVSGSFNIAEFVIQEAGRKVQRYNILIRAMCKGNDYERAGNLIAEMKQNGCHPNRTTFNLLVSCLCKNGKCTEACRMLEVIENDYGLPDASTFDLLINFFCKHGQIELALEFLDKMTLKGIEPCLLTHAAIIKAYFGLLRYKDAHKYVVDSAIKHRCSSNANYSLLAKLHFEKGNVFMAHKIINEMVDKGIKPNFPVYMKVKKCLARKNRNDLSSELTSRYTSLIRE